MTETPLPPAPAAAPAPAAVPTLPPVEAPPAPGHHDLRWYLHPRALFTGGNRVRLLRGGDEMFPAMCDAIERSRDEVWLATYIFHHDAAAKRVADALAAAARRGVRVHVVVDGFGSMSALPTLQRWWAGSGVRLTVFRPVTNWRALLQPEHLRRLHQKLCVVDAEVGYVGGINIIDDRHDLRHGPTAEPRLDFAVEVRGPVVAPVLQTTQAMWHRASFGEDWPDQMRALARAADPLARVRALLREVRIVAGDSVLADTADAPMLAAFVVRDNLRQRRAIERAYIDAFRRARTRIDLASPYFYPGRQFRRTLRDAVQRGVRVRLLLQGKLDYRIAGFAARSLYTELLSRGVHIHEYQAAFLHAKVALVDDDWATVGSSNIDPMSLLLNLEANVVVRDPDFTRELAAEFDRAIAQSREIKRPGLAQGPWAVLQRAAMAWLARLYLRVAGVGGRY
ncbi:cardiolipin synthase ClsB [Azohydromonas sediminis]|uniref:cardiolipin synthase ClsB n=1 Tax=Azohydromonas sediminis TaxID=2259674 RepID=UPI001F34C602|nr:cardiolipin synthase ClsB [Azohydromonas sediminis]